MIDSPFVLGAIGLLGSGWGGRGAESDKSSPIITRVGMANFDSRNSNSQRHVHVAATPPGPAADATRQIFPPFKLGSLQRYREHQFPGS